MFQRFFAYAFSGFLDQRLWTKVGGTRSTTSKVDVSEDSALTYAAVWCATRLICGTGASLPLPVYRGINEERREKFRKHPVYRLLNIAPNQEMTAFNFRAIMWQWQVNWGNAYAEIVREGNNPFAPVVELHPLNPSRVSIKRDEDGQLYYEVKNFGTEATELEPWQVLHLSSIITNDGIVGKGVIENARETIGVGLAAEKSAAHSFGGGKLPAIVVEHEGRWNDDVRQAFRKEWKEIYGGPDGDIVAVLQGGATAKPLGFNAQDSQFLESRQFTIEEIARWYGIPPHLLQHLLRATFNNVEELGIDFVRYGLVAWLEIWEQSIRQKLFTPDEQVDLFVEHNVDALMRGNAAARASFYQAMTSAAIMTRNECRKLENLDPVDGGDVYLVQGAMVPLDEDGKPESKFVNGGDTAALPAPSSDTPSDSQDDSQQTEEILASVSARLTRIVVQDLSRMLTKEANAVASIAKKGGNFVAQVDDFYAKHRDLLIDVLGESVEALNACGDDADKFLISAEWVEEGKRLILEAAGAATPKELPDAIQRVIESKTWTERPVRALERKEHATSLV